MTVQQTVAGLEGVLAPEHEGVLALLADGLARVDERLRTQMESDLPPVRALCEHVEKYRGKMLRPIMTLAAGLAARGEGASGADITDDHVTVGAVVEMIHLATLVHDDVLDEAETRRRGETVNKLRGNEVAVILGDYLISTAFHLCSQLDSQRTALHIGAITTRLCEGELLQLHHRDDLSLDEPTYYEIVERKTAELIGAACELGARCSGASDAACEGLRAYGVRLGVAFQIQDDLLDLTGDERVVGKPVGKDIEKGKLTLPLIHHLEHAPAIERGETIDLIRRWSDGGSSDSQNAPNALNTPNASDALDKAARARTTELMAALESTDSVAYARRSAKRLIEEAKAALAGAVEESGAASFLRAVADAVVSREY